MPDALPRRSATVIDPAMALLTAAHAAARKDGIAVGQVAAPELLAELERQGYRLTRGTEEFRIVYPGALGPHPGRWSDWREAVEADAEYEGAGAWVESRWVSEPIREDADRG